MWGTPALWPSSPIRHLAAALVQGGQNPLVLVWIVVAVQSTASTDVAQATQPLESVGVDDPIAVFTLGGPGGQLLAYLQGRPAGG